MGRRCRSRSRSRSRPMITLRSSDGDPFEVDEEVAVESQTIKHLIEEDCFDSGIPLPKFTCGILAKLIKYPKKHADSGIRLPNITSPILAKVIDFCKEHVESAKSDELKAWDSEFVKVNESTLFDLIMAAGYLKIKGLQDLGYQTLADAIKRKTPEELRKTFSIGNEFTPKEEDEIRREKQWAFE